jgi:hypothetical protein
MSRHSRASIGSNPQQNKDVGSEGPFTTDSQAEIAMFSEVFDLNQVREGKSKTMTSLPIQEEISGSDDKSTTMMDKMQTVLSKNRKKRGNRAKPEGDV